MEAERAPPHRFSVEEYYRRAEVGILGENDRAELLEGEIVDMPAIGSEHAGALERATRRLYELFGSRRHVVSVQDPVRLDPYNEPEPDLALLRWRDDEYGAIHPGPGDVLLLVEVLQSSADYDRWVKLPLYARFGIPEVWLLDLPADRLEVHRDPSAEGYRAIETVDRGGRVRALLVPKLELDPADLLPRRG